MPDETLRAYAPLAWFYDRYWGAEYHGRVLPVLERLLLARLPEGARILDVCCGTGHLDRELARRGYAVTGIDGSEEMLGYARRRVPEGAFFAADARHFRLPPVFNAAVSTFESLNHILSSDDLLSVFRNVSRALAAGGVFVFDLLTGEAYETLWQKSSAVVEDDNAFIIRGGYNRETRVGRTDITMFRRRETWERSDVTIFQKCHEPEEVAALLAQTSFQGISAYHAQRDLHISGDLSVGRLFYVAGK